MTDQFEEVDQEAGGGSSTPLKRISCSYIDGSSRYYIPKRDYSHQYCSLYFVRLSTLKMGTLRRSQHKRWGSAAGALFVESIKDIKIGQECCVSGTIYKNMKLKPSVMEQYNTDKSLELSFPRSTYTSNCDSLALEDATSRIALSCSEELVKKYITGIVVSMRGVLLEDGAFQVKDVCLPGLPPLTHNLPTHYSSGEGGDPLVAFVSGLRIGEAKSSTLRLQLLRDFLIGAAGGPVERELCSRIVRLVVVGDSMPASLENQTMGVLEEIDSFFAQIAPSLPLDVMPGPNDPTTYSLPQLPMHPILFKHCSRISSFKGTTNPYAFSVDGVRFLGTSGQPISDVCSFSELSPMEALKLTALSHCIAPTAPDTLACYPYFMDDPFCIMPDEFPDVLFAGNQKAMQYELLVDDENYAMRTNFNEEKVSESNDSPPTVSDTKNEVEDDSFKRNRKLLLLTLPAFYDSPELVLVNIKSLKVFSIKFHDF